MVAILCEIDRPLSNLLKPLGKPLGSLRSANWILGYALDPNNTSSFTQVSQLVPSREESILYICNLHHLVLLHLLHAETYFLHLELPHSKNGIVVFTESMSLHLYELNKWYWDILTDTIVEWWLKVQNHTMVWGLKVFVNSGNSSKLLLFWDSESIGKHHSWMVILANYCGLGVKSIL